ncbi:MAG: hypothetical protein HFF89_00025 [Oscillibacter sp.]|nr:hypothetical protein [Oscillibacter sp.]MCI8849627.1 hypothetical protein [Oscillibacter sp.]MCI9376146.1 hypothetical protein [Oscillibacter sp.]
MKYDLTPVEILKILGFDQPLGQEALKTFQESAHIPLPKVYAGFMEYAMNCPLLGTADLWCGQMIPCEMKPCFLYDNLTDAEKAQVCDYLIIGSDYGAGIVQFGLRVEDLDQEDPPVYLQHEANPKTEWSIAYETLSQYIREVVFNALALVDYETAEDEAEEFGWEYTDYLMDYWDTHAEDEEEDEDGDSVTEETLRQKGIDPDRVEWCDCTNGGKTFCCYDEEAGVFYTGRWDFDEENTLYTISRMDCDEDE